MSGHVDVFVASSAAAVEIAEAAVGCAAAVVGLGVQDSHSKQSSQQVKEGSPPVHDALVRVVGVVECWLRWQRAL